MRHTVWPIHELIPYYFNIAKLKNTYNDLLILWYILLEIDQFLKRKITQKSFLMKNIFINFIYIYIYNWVLFFHNYVKSAKTKGHSFVFVSKLTRVKQCMWYKDQMFDIPNMWLRIQGCFRQTITPTMLFFLIHWMMYF